MRDLELPSMPARRSARGRRSRWSAIATTDYSVPVACAHHEVQVRGYVHEVAIGCGTEIIARTSYEKADSDPRAGKCRRAGGALQGWDMSKSSPGLHRLLEAACEGQHTSRFCGTGDFRDGPCSRRQAQSLPSAMREASGALPDREARLDLDIYPYLKHSSTKPASYMSLMTQVP